MAKEKLALDGASIEDLRTQLGSMENELIQMKFDHAVKGLANPMELRYIRRDVARVQTEIRKRELAGMSAEELEMRSKLRARRRRQK
jgi:large subunit ribosomal protein L29